MYKMEIDADILEHLKRRNEEILESGRPDWENAPRSSNEARVAKELRFDIKIIEQLLAEAKVRRQAPNLLYHLLVSYYLIRLRHLQYAEGALEGLLEVFTKFMGEGVNNLF